MAFRVGQRVTMIGPREAQRPYGEAVPVFGVVYTIRELTRDEFGCLCLIFEEIRNPPHDYSGGFAEACFDAQCFRPLVSKSTDTGMGILRSLLNKQRVEA